MLIVVPLILLLLGLFFRGACRETRRPWLITAVSIALSAGLFILLRHIETGGSEGPFILAVLAASFAVGSLAGEIIFPARHE